MDIAGIVAAAVTVLTIGAAIASSARKDRFEERRLERMDEENTEFGGRKSITQSNQYDASESSDDSESATGSLCEQPTTERCKLG